MYLAEGLIVHCEVQPKILHVARIPAHRVSMSPYMLCMACKSMPLPNGLACRACDLAIQPLRMLLP